MPRPQPRGVRSARRAETGATKFSPWVASRWVEGIEVVAPVCDCHSALIGVLQRRQVFMF